MRPFAPDFCQLLFVLFAMAVFSACKPTERVGSGEVSIRFKSVTNDSYIFEMSNNSGRKVAFLGWKQVDGSVSPLFSASCKSQAPEYGAGIFVGPKSLPIDTQQTLELDASSFLKLSVPKSEFAPYGGARCSVTVLLEDDIQVDSDEFTPLSK
jgi:hypothetical protein